MVRITAVLALASVLLYAAEVKLGKPLALKETTSIASLVSEPGKYSGKTVQARGKVTGVCQKMGCWMNLADESGKLVRIKVKDGEIVFPKSAMGKMAVAEGKFTRLEEGGNVTYQIQGTGAVISE